LPWQVIITLQHGFSPLMCFVSGSTSDNKMRSLQ